jgi:hypothetical protein
MYMFIFDCISHVQAQTREEILEIRGLKAKVPVADEDGNYHTTEVPLIGPPIRGMIDNMLFMGAYGHKTMFESNRTRPAFRAAFAAYSLKVAIEKADDFFESWIEYRSRHPAERLAVHLAESADGLVDLEAMLGGDDDDDAPLFPPKAAPAAAAAAAGPAPAAADAAAAEEGNSD